MPWQETGPMQERVCLVMDVLEGRFTVAEAAAQRGVSRKTAYKYLNRYLEEGVAGLEERSRKPLSSPLATSSEVRELLIAEKKRRPHRGPKKLIDTLRKRHPSLQIPSPSTATAILRSAGLVERRRRRAPVLSPVWDRHRTPADAPNRVWTIDFKGEFRLGNKELCYPLTVVDLYSRDPRVIQALTSTRGAGVQAALTEVFRRDGLPEVIRSDRGHPFASHGIGNLSRLAVWWIKLGIRLERNDPGHPEQNGAHERMHRTLKAETARPPQFDFAAQQLAFDAFRSDYSIDRPHEGIGMRRPAELYVRSERAFPTSVPDVTYPGHYEVRSVKKNGCIKWKNELVFISQALEREHVGIEEIDEGLWSVYFGPISLGRFGLAWRSLKSAESSR